MLQYSEGRFYIIFSSLLLNLSLSHTFRSSSEILTFSSSFPSQSSYRKQMLKTRFNNAKADILDLNSIRFDMEISEMQFRINTHSFVHEFRYAFFFLTFSKTKLDYANKLNFYYFMLFLKIWIIWEKDHEYFTPLWLGMRIKGWLLFNVF